MIDPSQAELAPRGGPSSRLLDGIPIRNIVKSIVRLFAIAQVSADSYLQTIRIAQQRIRCFTNLE